MERKDCFFGLHIDLHPTERDVLLGADVTEENIARLLDAARPEHVGYDCKGHPGIAGYPSRVGACNGNLVRDSLAVWRKVTREKGVLLGIHYSGLWDDAAIAAHPAFAAIGPDGKPYGRATTPFGAYREAYLLPQLDEVIERYDLDSVWLDGECWAAQFDYSDMAQAAWIFETGLAEMPRGPGEPNWRRFKDFQRAHFLAYVRAWTGAVRAAHPRVNAASNWAFSTMMPIRKCAPVDFISGDFDPMLSVDRARTESRFLQHAGMPWELQSWSFDLLKSGDEAQKLPCHLMQEASIVLMHGGAYVLYFLPTRAGYLNDRIVGTAREVADFVHARRDCCFRSKPVPQVAVLHSHEAMMEKSDRVYTWWGTELREVEGALHALLESHYVADVMSEYMLEDRMGEYPVVVVPNSAPLTDAFVARLKAYVRDGGSLLLAGPDCVAPFADCLGVALGVARDERAVVDADGKFPLYGPWRDAEPVDAEIVAWRYLGRDTADRCSYMDVRADGVSPEMRAHMTKKPAATIRAFGKGKIAAIYGPFCKMYWDTHHPFLRALMARVMRDIFPAPMVTTGAPPCVDIALRTDARGRLSVQLANLSNLPVGERRAYADFIPPLYNIKVSVRMPEKPARVLSLPDGAELPATFLDGVATVTLPRLDVHAAVAFE